jgi:hypothetical protein
MSAAMAEPDKREQLDNLLAEVKSDPVGWSSLDLSKLLDLAGFEKETIHDAQGWPQEFRYHVSHPDLNVVLSPVERVHAAVAMRVITIVEQLGRRQG